jgi:hypothetical protein
VISNQPLEPILDLIAVIAAVVLGGGLIVVGRRARTSS